MIRLAVSLMPWALTLLCLTSCAARHESAKSAHNETSGLPRASAGDQNAASASLRLEAELNRLVPRILEAYAVPGAAVGIIRDGKVSSATGYGHRDLAGRQPITADTVFNVGSISKSVTAWGVMRLVQDGRIALDTPVSDYLTRWKIPP